MVFRRVLINRTISGLSPEIVVESLHKRLIEHISGFFRTFGSEMDMVASRQAGFDPLKHSTLSAHGIEEAPIGGSGMGDGSCQSGFETGQNGIGLHGAMVACGHIARSDKENSRFGCEAVKIFYLLGYVADIFLYALFRMQAGYTVAAILENDEAGIGLLKIGAELVTVDAGEDGA